MTVRNRGGCFATLIHPGWMPTSAHCFESSQPAGVTIEFAAPGRTPVSAAGDEQGPFVFFHPQAVAVRPSATNADGRWVGWFTVQDVDCGHDLALVRVPLFGEPTFGQPLPGQAVLYNPPCSSAFTDCTRDIADTLEGEMVEFPGRAGEQLVTGRAVLAGARDAQDSKTAEACINTTQSPVLFILTRDSYTEEGDSGGGLFARPRRPSNGFGSLCSLFVPFADGDRALVGVTQGGVDSGVTGEPLFATFVPVYTPSHAGWIRDRIVRGLDGDAVCDEFDACPDTFDAQVRNSNAVAEQAWGSASGIHGPRRALWDSCDPAPVPVPRLDPLPGMPPPPSGGFRAIRRVLAVDPWLEVDGPVADTITPRFCVCSDEDGTPISNTGRCSLPPFHCELNPAIIVEGRAEAPTRLQPPAGNQTTWRKLGVLGAGGFEFGSKHPVTYPSPAAPLAVWAYASDSQRWIATGMIPAVAAEPGFPPGTDLAGTLWLHGASPAGASEHGATGVGCLSQPEPRPAACAATIADGYALGVAPDRKSGVAVFEAGSSGGLSAGFSGCTGCDSFLGFPGDQPDDTITYIRVNPSTLQSSSLHSGFRSYPADAVLSSALRSALVSPSLTWIASSEPLGVGQTTLAPRSFALGADGSTVIDALGVSAAGFALASEFAAAGCPAGQLLVRCEGGDRCAVPCDGAQGDDGGVGADPSCIAAYTADVLGAPASDEEVCAAPGGSCAAGQFACGGECATPCDGAAQCLVTDLPGPPLTDELPAVCGGAGGEGTGDSRVVPTAARMILAAAGSPERPPARARHATAWSRVHGMLVVAGGVGSGGEPQRDVWTLWADRGWNRAELVGEPVPASVQASVYSWRDARLWILDDEARGGGGGRPRGRAWRLYRVDPVSGFVDTRVRVPALDAFDRVYLTTIEDGRVLLSAATASRFVVVLLSTRPFSGTATVDVDGVLHEGGELAAPPQVSEGRITVAQLVRRGRERLVDVRPLASIERLHEGWGRLAHELR